MELNEILGKYSEKYSKDVEELKTSYQTIYESLSDVANETVRRNKSLTKLTSEIKRAEGISASTTPFEGVVIYAPPAEDEIERSRMISTRIFNKDPNRAVNDGWTNEDGVPLDRRPWAMGKDNENKGMPLSGEDWRRTIVGLAKKDGGEYKLFRMRFYGDKAREEMNIPTITPCKFNAIEKKNEPKVVLLNASQNTKFDVIDGATFDLEATLHSLDAITSLKNVEEWYEYNKKDWNAMIITEGNVYGVRRQPNNNGRRSVSLTLPEEPDVLRSFSVKEGIDLDFDDDSRVIIFGKVGQIDDNLWVDTYGIYALPEYLIPYEEKEPVEQTTVETPVEPKPIA